MIDRERVAAIAAQILAKPVEKRLDVFALAMRKVLDEIAAAHPRSTPREIMLRARKVGAAVLSQVREARRAGDA